MGDIVYGSENIITGGAKLILEVIFDDSEAPPGDFNNQEFDNSFSGGGGS